MGMELTSSGANERASRGLAPAVNSENGKNEPNCRHRICYRAGGAAQLDAKWRKRTQFPPAKLVTDSSMQNGENEPNSAVGVGGSR
jgi:hypothetical protein